MPKKTKKQKIKAESRRQEFLLRSEKNEEKANFSTEKPKKIVSLKPDITIKSDEDDEVKKYFKLDLKKSLIIISAIIALEIVIYFGTIIKYFK